MFETVVPPAVGLRSRARHEALPVSLAVHLLLGAGAVAGTVWEIDFPAQSPSQFAMYSLIDVPSPPPPPPPPAPRRLQPAQQQAQPVKTVAMQLPVMAPVVIPEEIPIVAPAEPPLPLSDVPIAAVPSLDNGVTGGVPGGVAGGEAGGTLGGVVGSVGAGPPSEVVTIERDLPLPMTMMSQEYPLYPEAMRKRGQEDTLVVRYVIDKRGRVREVTVIVPPAHQEFAKEAVAAIRNWRFRPFEDEGGVIREVVHELTVNFELRVRRR